MGDAWVGFRTKADAAAFERVERVQNRGDITPLGGALLGLAHVHFTGHHYHSRPNGTKFGDRRDRDRSSLLGVQVRLVGR
jgi:hypothetical protein